MLCGEDGGKKGMEVKEYGDGCARKGMGIPATFLTVGEMSDEGIERGGYGDERERQRKGEKIYIPSLNSPTMTWIKSLSSDSRTLFMNMGAVQRRSGSTRWGRQICSS